MGLRKFLLFVLLGFASFSTSAKAWDGECSECCNCDSRCCWNVYFDFESVILQPCFSRNNAYFLENPSGLDGQRAVMFDWDYKYSPRFELGVLNCCDMGGRLRYWFFHHDLFIDARSPNGEIATWFAEDGVTNEIGFSNATRAEFTHRIKLDVVDFEALFKQQCYWTYSAGGRYLRMNQKYKAVETAPGFDSFQAKHDFHGAGLTSAVEFFRPIWCSLSFFTKARGSFLYGDSHFAATNLAKDGEIASKNECDILAIGELQLGLDWRFTFCNKYCSFIRFAIETQYWIGGGAAGPGDNAVYDEGNYQNSNPQDANLGFFGFNVAIGMTY